MNIVSFSMRSMGVCLALAMMTACAGSQIATAPPAALPQPMLSIDSAPMMATCPMVGKTYKRSDGKGQVSMTFREAYAKAGSFSERLRTRLVYNNWPENRPTIYRNLTITTCGPESGKAPVGETGGTGGSVSEECHNGVCTITLNLEIIYRPPATLPGGKKWKFDLIRIAPDKPMKGFDPIPAYRVIITR
jgi:hypothetical protein